MSDLVQIPWATVPAPPVGADRASLAHHELDQIYARAAAEIEEWMDEADDEAQAIIDRAVVMARRDAARIRADATEYAADTLASAETDAARIRQSASEAVSRLLYQARREAERIRAAAHAEARSVLDGRQLPAPPPRNDAKAESAAASHASPPPPPPAPTPSPYAQPPSAPYPQSPSAPRHMSAVPAPPAPAAVAQPASAAVAQPAAPRPSAPYLSRSDAHGSAPPLLHGLDDVVTPRRRWRIPISWRGRGVA
ncbi:MAG TPA: hypothetical protein VGR90_05895 [Acidimicrobiales bacterium]|nr:hypothetical protein [Acidimicrobiales bacterium]